MVAAPAATPEPCTVALLPISEALAKRAAAVEAAKITARAASAKATRLDEAWAAKNSKADAAAKATRHATETAKVTAATAKTAADTARAAGYQAAKARESSLRAATACRHAREALVTSNAAVLAAEAVWEEAMAAGARAAEENASADVVVSVPVGSAESKSQPNAIDSRRKDSSDFEDDELGQLRLLVETAAGRSPRVDAGAGSPSTAEGADALSHPSSEMESDSNAGSTRALTAVGGRNKKHAACSSPHGSDSSYVPKKSKSSL